MALSLASDLGMGIPAEHSLRAGYYDQLAFLAQLGLLPEPVVA